VLYAIKTNVLPAARDVCSEYLWHRGLGVKHMWQYLFHLLVTRAEQWLVVDVRNEIRENEFLQKNCTMNDPKFHRMSMEHISDMETEYSWITIPFSICLGVMFLGPHLLYAFHNKLLPRKIEDAETVDEEQDLEIESLSTQTMNHKLEISDLKKRMLDLEEQLRTLK